MACVVSPLVFTGAVEDRHSIGEVNVGVSSSPNVPEALAGHVRTLVWPESLIESNGASDD